MPLWWNIYNVAISTVCGVKNCYLRCWVNVTIDGVKTAIDGVKTAMRGVKTAMRGVKTNIYSQRRQTTVSATIDLTQSLLPCFFAFLGMYCFMADVPVPLNVIIASSIERLTDGLLTVMHALVSTFIIGLAFCRR